MKDSKKEFHVVSGFNFAIDGLIGALKAEHNMKIHLFAAFSVVVLAMLLEVSRWELVSLCITVTMVLGAELINTAIESTVDLITEEKNPLAKIAKDVSAAAVLITALNALIVGYLIFFDRLRFYSETIFYKFTLTSNHWIVVIVAFILMMTLVLKAVFYEGRGSHMKGGTVSGHAALSFSLATINSLISKDGRVILISYIIALMVAQSRVEGKIHRTRDVFAGAVLGLVGTFLAFYILF